MRRFEIVTIVWLAGMFSALITAAIVIVALLGSTDFGGSIDRVPRGWDIVAVAPAIAGGVLAKMMSAVVSARSNQHMHAGPMVIGFGAGFMLTWAWAAQSNPRQGVMLLMLGIVTLIGTVAGSFINKALNPTVSGASVAVVAIVAWLLGSASS